MASNREVNLREATLDDYEAVCAIDTTLFGGSDSLPHVFHKYMQDPNRICYVLEVNGKIASTVVDLLLSFMF